MLYLTAVSSANASGNCWITVLIMQQEPKITRLRLNMRKDDQAGYCVITLEDNGPGIDKAQMKQVFEPFFSTRKEGSGLGLYIARQLCEANQSELTVDS